MAGIVHDKALERDERASREALPLGEIGAELFPEKVGGGDDGVGAADAVKHQVAKTRAHRITHHQRARQHSDRRSYAQHNCQVRAPVVRQAAANQRGCAHQ
jgi:hypothetical protein